MGPVTDELTANTIHNARAGRSGPAVSRTPGGAGGPSISTATPCLVHEDSSLIRRAGLPLTVAGPARNSVSWRPALIAASMLAAPAMAASTAKTETAPITKSLAPAAKPQLKPSVRNANAKMVRHHHRHYSHHRSHKKMSAYKINKVGE